MMAVLLLDWEVSALDCGAVSTGGRAIGGR